VKNALRSLWDEPRVPNPPARVWRDWVLVAVLLPAAVIEGILRDGVAWRPAAIVLGAVPVFGLLWRRTHPLAVVAVAFGAHAAADLVVVVGAHHSAILFTSAYVLLLPYSLFRWGSGRDAAYGTAIFAGGHLLTGAIAESAPLIETVFGIGFLFSIGVLGAAVRYRASSRVREIDEVKLREREQLARELHDTVAHHVSAIAIQAQAGRTVASADPDAAVDALRLIEGEASRTLTEMRAMVGALRQGEDAEFVPQRGVADIERLAGIVGDSPCVEVALSGDLDGLMPSLDAALYRLAQESITNATRHARRATRIDVWVAGEDDCVRLSVSDDGDPISFGAISASGYGIVGMTERATLLGGTLDAGPRVGRGWAVNAVLPRNGAVR
jgi:signal transduction histidine kinase